MKCQILFSGKNNDNEFRFNDMSTIEGHLRQNGILTGKNKKYFNMLCAENFTQSARC